MDDIVRANIRWQGPPIARRKIFEKLDAWPRVRPHSSDAQMRSEHLIQMFLFSPEIFALARSAQSEQVAIKLQAGVGIRDPDRSVVDSEEQLVGFFLPAWIAFARRKINHLEVMLVGIAKIERFDSGSSFNRAWQRLWTRRNELHLQCSQFCNGLIHVA